MIEVLKTIEEVLSHNLREFRGDRNQQDVADACGIPFRTYQDLESGVIPRKRIYLISLAKYYNVTVTRFFQDPELHPDQKQIKDLKLRHDLIRQILAASPDQAKKMAVAASTIFNATDIFEVAELTIPTRSKRRD
jgi:transcriptional regulator with XRE-family HTH domain